jgi:integrase
LPDREGTSVSRRANLEGTVSSYRTASGEERFRVAYWTDLPSGERIRRFKRGFVASRDAENALEDIRVDQRRGEHLEEVKDTLNAYSSTYFDGLRVRDTTLAGYRKHYRVHVQPSRVGKTALTDITKDKLNVFYRELERSGRKDAGHEGESLSAATVRHVHVLISQILAHAVDDGLLRANVAKKASPPTKLEAAAPEMQVWSAEEAKAFLRWSDETGDYLNLAWRTLLGTGMRRGELLGLRWRDIDLEHGVITIARAMSYVKEAGKPPVISFKRPKSGRGRNVDIDAALCARLAARKQQIGATAPELVKADQIVFCNRYGRPHNPVQFSRQWRERVAAAIVLHPDLPKLHLHELRHAHATLLLTAGEHPKVVSERLGHSSVQITMDTYSHAIRTMQRGAADRIGDLLG